MLAFFGVIMGISNIAVSRLTNTWEKLPSKFKKLFKEFETLLVSQLCFKKRYILINYDLYWSVVG